MFSYLNLILTKAYEHAVGLQRRSGDIEKTDFLILFSILLFRTGLELLFSYTQHAFEVF